MHAKLSCFKAPISRSPINAARWMWHDLREWWDATRSSPRYSFIRFNCYFSVKDHFAVERKVLLESPVSWMSTLLRSVRCTSELNVTQSVIFTPIQKRISFGSNRIAFGVPMMRMLSQSWYYQETWVRKWTVYDVFSNSWLRVTMPLSSSQAIMRLGDVV